MTVVIGISITERVAREALDQGRVFDETLVRGLLHDVETWREIAIENRDVWSFDTLMMVGRRLLATIYPESIFNGSSRDSGPQYVVALRAAIERLDEQDKLREKYNAVGVSREEPR